MEKKHLLDGKTILIVDDEPDVLETLEDLLPMCQMTKASTFEEAWDKLGAHYYDMAILDIMGVDGYRLLELAKTRKVPAVMLTAHALSPDHLKKSYEGGLPPMCPKTRWQT
jgi:CheY-like chemotaxis protein